MKPALLIIAFVFWSISESLNKSEPNHWYLTNSQGKGLIELLKTYQINRQQVANARQAAFTKVRLAREAQNR